MSTVKYVYPHGENKFQTFVRVSGKRVSLGLFDDAEVAAGVHDSIAWHALGERRLAKLSLPWDASNPPPRLEPELAAFAEKFPSATDGAETLRDAVRSAEAHLALLRRMLADSRHAQA